MNRIAVYFFYDKEGIVDDYVDYFLQDLILNLSELHIVINGIITEEGLKKLRNITTNIILRENVGFDVWAYKAAIEKIGYDRITSFDELVLLNFTNFGPLYPFSEMFTLMEKRNVDFWGITKSLGTKVLPSNPFDDINEHVQSYFIAIRNKMLRSKYFKKYWDDRPEIKTFNDALIKHEFIFTKYFSDQGFTYDTYVNMDRFEHNMSNPLSAYPLDIIVKDRCPVFKRKPFFTDSREIFHNTCCREFPSAIEYIKNNTNYDIKLIWQNLLRSQNLKTLVRNANLNYFVSTKKSDSENIQKRAVILDLFRYDNLDYCWNYLKNIPTSVDIIIVFDDREKKNIIIEKLKGLDNKYIFLNKNIFTDNNYLLDISYDVLKKYDVVGYLHNKQVESGHPDTFRAIYKDHFDNMLDSEDIINNSFDLFDKNQEIGVLFSGVNKYKNFNNFPNSGYIKKLLSQPNIKIKFYDTEKPFYFDSCFCWFRPSILEDLSNEKFRYKYLLYSITPYLAQGKSLIAGYVYNEKMIKNELNLDEYLLEIKPDLKPDFRFIKKLKLFSLFPILDLKYKKDVIYVNLFRLFPLLKIKIGANKAKVFLFYVLPILKIIYKNEVD